MDGVVPNYQQQFGELEPRPLLDGEQGFRNGE